VTLLHLRLQHLIDCLAHVSGERTVARKVVSFALVGAVNAVVDTAVFFSVLIYLNSSLVLANVVSWLVAVTSSYVMNSLTTFAAESGRNLRFGDYLRFVGSGVIAVTATTITVVLAAKFMPIWAAKGIAILVSLVVNFSITHFIVFRPAGRRVSGAR
jgi:putative flippase GtrA